MFQHKAEPNGRGSVEPNGRGRNHKMVTRFLSAFLNNNPEQFEALYDKLQFGQMNDLWFVFCVVCLLWGKLILCKLGKWCLFGMSCSNENGLAKRVRILLCENGKFGLYSKLKYGGLCWLRVYDEWVYLCSKLRKVFLFGMGFLLTFGLYFNTPLPTS